MKLKAKFWLVLNEFKASRTLFVFLWLTMSIALCSVFFAYLLKTYYVDSFYENINRENDYKFTVDILGTSYSKIDELNKIGFKEIKVNADAPMQISFNLNCSSDSANFSSLKTGLLTSAKYMGNKHIAFVSKQLADEYSLEIGDWIQQIYDENVIETYQIVNYLESDNDSDNDIFLPFDTCYLAMRDNGIEIKHTLSGIITDSSSYTNISKIASAMSITLSSDYDNGFKFIEVVESLFFVFLILMIIFVLVGFNSLYRMVVKNRMGFIGRFLLLGGRCKDVDCIYAILSLILICASFITSELFIIPIKRVIKNMILEYFGLTYLNRNNFTFAFIVFIISIIIAAFSISLEGKYYRNLEIVQQRDDK